MNIDPATINHQLYIDRMDFERYLTLRNSFFKDYYDGPILQALNYLECLYLNQKDDFNFMFTHSSVCQDYRKLLMEIGGMYEKQENFIMATECYKIAKGEGFKRISEFYFEGKNQIPRNLFDSLEYLMKYDGVDNKKEIKKKHMYENMAKELWLEGKKI